MEKSVEAIEDELERELELNILNLEKMFRSMAFFTNCTVEALKDEQFVGHIVNIYVSSLDLVFKDEQRVIEIPEYKFVFKGEEWEIHEPELKHGDRMKFGEFIDSKQTIQNMIALGKNRWECLIPLCAIFLRKVGEEYEESFLYEGSDRQELMKELPLDIALHVGFFLSGSLSTLAATFQSSNLQE